MQFRVFREGNISVNGNLNVYYIGANGEKILLNEMNGVSVFTPNKYRIFQIDNIKHKKIDLSTGEIKIQYSSNNDIKPIKYAENTFRLNE